MTWDEILLILKCHKGEHALKCINIIASSELYCLLSQGFIVVVVVDFGLNINGRLDAEHSPEHDTGQLPAEIKPFIKLINL